MKAGDIVKHIYCGGYSDVKVVKVNAKSVRLKRKDGTKYTVSEKRFKYLLED